MRLPFVVLVDSRRAAVVLHVEAMFRCPAHVLACLKNYVGYHQYLCMNTTLRRIKQTHVQCSQVCPDLKKYFHKIQVDAKVGDTCHFKGSLVHCENKVRRVIWENPCIGFMEETSVLNVILADEDGVVQVTLYREIANDQYPILDKSMDQVREGFCPKLKLTHLIVREPRIPAVQSMRVLHCTKKKVNYGGSIN